MQGGHVVPMFDKNEVQMTQSALGFANEPFDSHRLYVVDLVLIHVLRDKRFFFRQYKFHRGLDREG